MPLFTRIVVVVACTALPELVNVWMIESNNMYLIKSGIYSYLPMDVLINTYRPSIADQLISNHKCSNKI